MFMLNEVSSFKRFGTWGYRLVVEYVFRLHEALGTVYSHTQDWACSPMIECLTSIHKALSSLPVPHKPDMVNTSAVLGAVS